FGPRPELVSGFYIAVVFEGEIVLLVGDLEKEAFGKTKLKKFAINNNNDNNNNNRKKLQPLVIRREHVFGNRFYTTRTDFGGKSRVLRVKHLKWKFRGSERIEVDGYPIQLSWDVCTFRFEKQGNESMQLQECFDDDNNGGNNTPKKGKKMKKKLLVKTRSSSSFSISSASSGSSFVLEWESVEENEMKGLNGFSLM
ncbi:Ventricular zone-expressed PH domain-containing protein 1, partial [Bienertia sinuspersici]